MYSVETATRVQFMGCRFLGMYAEPSRSAHHKKAVRGNIRSSRLLRLA